MTRKKIDSLIVAIDGPAGSGKSSVGREVARRLGLRYVDTGAMYRAVALAALRSGIDPDDEGGLAGLIEHLQLKTETANGPFRVSVNGEDVTVAIRQADVDAAVSQVAQWGKVRERMVRLQRQIAHGGGIVMEGRDIGTVVFPNAQVKIFLDASAAERARRRSAEKQTETEGHVAAAIRRRDEEDQTRERSPLRCAPDAVHIDSTRMSIEDVVERVILEVARVKEKAENP